jgi:anti-anti-sigma regulatory factor
MARLPGKARMLKIHRSVNGEVVFKLIGRMDGDHLTEVETLIRAEAKGRRIVLDLKDTTLVGQEGIDFLVQCEAADISLVNCAAYVREWITRQRSGR